MPPTTRPSPSPPVPSSSRASRHPPVTPAPPPAPDVTCWDGTRTTARSACGLPEGARGLAWVFPSFAEDRALCHKARPNPKSYPVTHSFVCFERALGKPVTITYDQIADVDRVERWLLKRVGKDNRRIITGPDGGRIIFSDGRVRPARITGMYGDFPYVVSVYAESPPAAVEAWRSIVKQRPPQHVRGVKD